MKNILISVIVPIYNVEQYLCKCIDSIIGQTYNNLEIILVDDGSPDNCPAICDEYALQDPRVTVIHKKNGGLSDARNAGIKNAYGEYVIFIDSDDFIERDMIEKLHKSIQENDSDIAVCNFDYYYENGTKEIPEMQIENKSMSGYDSAKLLLYTLEPQMVVAWNKLEKKSLWDNMEFPVGKQHEDDFTTYQLFYNSQMVSFVDEPLYHYYQRGNSIIGVGFNEKSLHKIEAYEEAMLFFKNKDKKLYARCCNIVLIMIKRCCDEARTSNYLEKNSVIANLKKKGRRFYIKNAMNIKRGLKYHIKMFWYFFA